VESASGLDVEEVVAPQSRGSLCAWSAAVIEGTSSTMGSRNLVLKPGNPLLEGKEAI